MILHSKLTLFDEKNIKMRIFINILVKKNEANTGDYCKAGKAKHIKTN